MNSVDYCVCLGCFNNATETENSPNMNDYCDDCTYERHDITYDNLHPLVNPKEKP